MKPLIILGALIGFLIGSGFGLASHSPWPAALWRACAAALLSAVMVRWWSQRWLDGLRQALEQKAKSQQERSGPVDAATPTVVPRKGEAKS